MKGMKNMYSCSAIFVITTLSLHTQGNPTNSADEILIMRVRTANIFIFPSPDPITRLIFVKYFFLFGEIFPQQPE